MAYTKITQEEAKYLMDTRDNILIIDVRNPEEFAEGHIPHAINIPNPSITNRDIPELPDKNQELLVYCRSGQRIKHSIHVKDNPEMFKIKIKAK